MTKMIPVELPPMPHRRRLAPVIPDRQVELHVDDTVFALRDRCVVMGILNRTPDSFFDKGEFFERDEALRHADEMVGAGADIIDVGGVKAGPGEHVSPAEEMDRVVPTIEAIHDRIDVPVSIDSFRPVVARAAVEAGAAMVNDISGLADPEMIDVAVEHDVAIVICHIQGRPRVANPDPQYLDMRSEVHDYMGTGIERCRAAGITDDKIVVDHAFDFGKSETQSVELLAHTADLATWKLPIMIAASNKRFLGQLCETDVSDRRGASLAAAAVGIHQGGRILRVHDVRATRRVADTTMALIETVSR